jgi:peptidoglycan/LPS O-acetylase OafA/YrhL
MKRALSSSAEFFTSNFKFGVPWSQEGENTKWNFLNGYRGFLALYVVLAHSKDRNRDEIIDFAIHSSRVIALFGFFVMSAFLLTYRLLKDLMQSKSTTSDCIIIVKYALRRFFRIYIVVIMFILFLRYARLDLLNTTQVYTDPMLTILLLERPSVYAMHLWTIPVEVKYYFIIPIICLIFVASKRFLNNLIVPFVLGCVLATINEFYNLCGVTKEDMFYYNVFSSGQLRVRFFVFFYGSLAAIALILIESNKELNAAIKNRNVQRGLVAVLFVIIFYVFRFRTQFFYPEIEDTFSYETIPSLCWAVCIVIMVLTHPNPLTSYLSSSSFLVSSGKYSFGIYLWHLVVLDQLRNNSYVSIKSEVIDVLSTITVSYFVAYVFFCLVEDPFMKFANYLCTRIEVAINNRYNKQGDQLAPI